MKNNSMAGKGQYRAGHQGGFIKIIVIIVVALLVLSYFGFNLRSLADSPTTQDNFSYAASTTVNVWSKYLAKPATYVWNEIFLNLIWNPALEQLKHSNTVAPTASTP